MSDEPQTSLPTTKVARAARFAKTGLNVGANYVKHYAKRRDSADRKAADHLGRVIHRRASAVEEPTG